MRDECEHGSLRRQCDRCEMQARIAELETALRQGVRCECSDDDVCAFARRIAELERERERFFAQQMETADWVQMSREHQQRAEQAERQLANCAPYLKDGESPAACIARNRADVDAALSLLAERTRERDEARADFAALCHALVGDTGASAMLTAEALRAERDRLWKALARYGQHDGSCLNGITGTCRCGLDAALRGEEG